MPDPDGVARALLHFFNKANGFLGSRCNAIEKKLLTTGMVSRDLLLRAFVHSLSLEDAAEEATRNIRRSFRDHTAASRGDIHIDMWQPILLQLGASLTFDHMRLLRTTLLDDALVDQSAPLTDVPAEPQTHNTAIVHSLPSQEGLDAPVLPQVRASSGVPGAHGRARRRARRPAVG